MVTMATLLQSLHEQNLMGNFYFSKSYIETNQLIDSVNQLSGFYTNMLLLKRNSQKDFS